MTTIHVSDLPRLAHCNGALSLTGPAIGYDDVSASMGSALHEAASAIVHGQTPPDMAYVGTIRAIWSELSGLFSCAQAEVAMRGVKGQFEFVGKADVVALGEGHMLVLDWFAGLQATDKEEQGKGYCWLALQGSAFDRVVFYEASIQTGTFRAWSWSRAELDAWMDSLVYNLSRPERFTTGDWCRWCPKYLACPAHHALMKRTFDDLALVGWVENLPRERKGEVYPALQAAARMVEAAIESIKADVVSNGPIPMGEDYELRASEIQRLEIDAMRAWPLLTSRFSAEELSTAIAIRKGDLEGLAADKVGRGQKGAAKKKIIEDLKASGAVTETTTYRVAKARKGE